MDGVLSCIPYVLDNRSKLYRSTCIVMPQKKKQKKHCIIFSCMCKQRNEKKCTQVAPRLILVQANLYYQKTEVAFLQLLFKL